MEPFIGQIQPFGFNFAPRGWSFCNGQLLPISSHQALFSLLGTTFGGDGRTSFGLPDLRGRSIVHVGSGGGLSNIRWGERGGIENITLNNTNLPSHSHTLSTAKVTVQTVDNGSDSPETDNGTNVLGTSGNMPDIYRESPSGTDHLGGVSISGTTDNTGGSRPIQTRNPFLGVYVSIALLGIFPSRN